MHPSIEAADAQRSDLIGQILGGAYRVLRQLDSGGMGMVYEAEHVRLHRALAVKIMAGHLSQDANALARFQREAEIVSQLEHPHIVQVVDFDTTPQGQPFLVMELLRGRSLESRLEQGMLPISEAILIATQAASGLSAAHRSDIVHRDLKPANIFLLDSDRVFVKLLDFGISKRAGHSRGLTGEFDILGTPDYMAPVQALGKTALVDHRGDQFALAVITYEMLTGTLPFAASEVMEVLQRVIRDTPTPPSVLRPEIPASIDAALLRALSKHPEQRFPSIADFADALSADALNEVSRTEWQVPRRSSPPPLGSHPPQGTSSSDAVPSHGAPSAPPAISSPPAPSAARGEAERGLALTGLRGALPARPTPPRDQRLSDPRAGDLERVPARVGEPPIRGDEATMAPPAERTSKSPAGVSLRPSLSPQRELPSPRPSASLSPPHSPSLVGPLPPNPAPHLSSVPGAFEEPGRYSQPPRRRLDSVSEGHAPRPEGLHVPSEPPPTTGPAQPQARRSTSWSKKDPATTVRDLIARAHQELGLDTPELALSYAESALSIADELSTHAEVKQQVEANTRVLERIFERVIGRLDAAIVLGEVPSGVSPLSPHQAFLLSRVDGHMTVEEALDLSPLSRMQTLRHLADLLRSGYLRLDRTTIDRPTSRRREP